MKEIHQTFAKGDAREESFYDSLKKLITITAEHLNKTGITITTNPKKTEGGNPDFRVWDGKSRIVGYVEAKRPEVNLDDIENTEQIKRYKDIFPNFVLTNFLEFQFYRDGRMVDHLFIGRKHTLVVLGTKPVPENEEKFVGLFDKFFSFTFPQNLNARRLAKELAKRTRFLRDQVILEEIREESREGCHHLLGFYEAFKTYLIIGLSKEDFADLYSQTITYGLFAARTRSKEDFNRKKAVEFIPPTIGTLHHVFQFISLGQVPRQLEWIIDDIAEVLASANVSLILNEFFQYGKGDDPIVHFYETFLSEYNPRLREKRGVYYTPYAVVSFIVRSLHIILKEHFNKPDGLADLGIKILDPAAGTLTFIAEAARLALEEYVKKYGKGVKEDFIRNHLLKNFYAFELMMAPYAVGHLKMSYVFQEMGYQLKNHDRFNLYLTNTLDMQDIEQTDLPGMATLSEESHLAGKIKKETPILIILGNPPYSGISSNKGLWITEQIEKYKYIDGKHFGEKKHWLQDDYVKFIRFSQWKIDQTGEGCIGLITNNGYLDNPTFRGMRQALMESFQEIFILNLHGNSNKKEKCPDGSLDKNVFDIRQGVVIALFIKKRNIQSESKIFYADLWGLRENKYEWLEENDLKTVSWKQLQPSTPYYFFIPRDIRHEKEYNKFIKISDIFPVNVTGIVTARDHFVIDFSYSELRRRIETFKNLSIPDDFIEQTYKLKDTRGWKLIEKRKELSEEKDWSEKFQKILYRPFDIREIYYSELMVDWPRPEVMPNMFKENLGIILPKQFKEEPGAFVTGNIIGHKTVSIYDINYLFPLYLYPNPKNKGLFENLENHKSPLRNPQPNINPKIFDLFGREGFKPSPTPEQIFYYIYAVLYSNIYREKYTEFLKIDFPRIPFTKDYDLFIKLSKLGQELADIHLLKSDQLNKTFSRFEVAGNNNVEKVTYGDKKIYINKTQYFSDIEKNIWEYQIGGYQVMHKWLKDRKGRTLTLEDIQHYIKVARVLQLTIEYQKKIDKSYIKVEEKLIRA